MIETAELDTRRLKLRQWLPGDYSLFAEINSDPVIMNYYPAILNETESNAFADKISSLILKKGWGFWAVELMSNKQFIGFVGLHEPEARLPFSPCIEIGWRLSKKHWGYGYATEAANAALKFAFETLLLDDVVSFTSLQNNKSRAVMERLNMIDVKENFQHPNIPANSPLSEHVLYKITKSQWLDNT